MRALCVRLSICLHPSAVMNWLLALPQRHVSRLHFQSHAGAIQHGASKGHSPPQDQVNRISHGDVGVKSATALRVTIRGLVHVMKIRIGGFTPPCLHAHPSLVPRNPLRMVSHSTRFYLRSLRTCSFQLALLLCPTSFLSYYCRDFSSAAMGKGVAVKKASPRKPAKKSGAPAFRGARRPFYSPVPRVVQNPLRDLKQVGMITLSQWSEAESKRYLLKAKVLPPTTELRPRSRRCWACNEPYRAKPRIRNGYDYWCCSDLFLFVSPVCTVNIQTI
jgi:hypothetical protein